MIRVTILSPNHALRVGLRELLEAQPDIKISGEAKDVNEINAQETEVLVLASVSSASLSEVFAGSYGVVMLTDFSEDVRKFSNSLPSAGGILPASASGEDLAAAIRAVGEGLWVAAPGMVQALIRTSSVRDSSDEEALIEPLTAREKEVLQLIAEGLANKQIAILLGISEHTVKFHLSSLYAKLNVSSRTEAVKRGLNLGLISL